MPRKPVQLLPNSANQHPGLLTCSNPSCGATGELKDGYTVAGGRALCPSCSKSAAACVSGGKA